MFLTLLEDKTSSNMVIFCPKYLAICWTAVQKVSCDGPKLSVSHLAHKICMYVISISNILIISVLFSVGSVVVVCSVADPSSRVPSILSQDYGLCAVSHGFPVFVWISSRLCPKTCRQAEELCHVATMCECVCGTPLILP